MTLDALTDREVDRAANSSFASYPHLSSNLSAGSCVLTSHSLQLEMQDGDTLEVHQEQVGGCGTLY